MNTHETTDLTLTLDGQPFRVTPGTSLADLLAQHPSTRDLPPERYATAINGRFIARAQRLSQPLQGGDAVTLFQAIVGG
jgi:sulfur carrier protein